MKKIYMTIFILACAAFASSEFNRQGAIHNIVDYRQEIGVPRPWASFEQYNETLDNATFGPVNEYVSAVSNFAKKKCPIEYCKHVLIVGDDFVIPMGRYMSADKIIFSDYDYATTSKSGKRDLLLPKMNSLGRLDSDGDGWSDEEETGMHTAPNNSSDNFCTKLPSIGKALDGTLEPQYWIDLLKRTTFDNDTVSSQSTSYLSAGARGLLTGITHGVGGGLKSDAELIGIITLMLTNIDTYIETAKFTVDYFLNQLPTQCTIIKKGGNIIGQTPTTYFNEVIPFLYTEAEKASPGKSFQWDKADENIFSDTFVTGYHIGYITEQIIIAKGAGKILKPAEAMKSLETGRMAKGTTKEAIETIGKQAEAAITRLKNLGATDEMINTILTKGADLSRTIFAAKNSKIVAWLEDGPIGWGWKHIVEGKHDIHIQEALNLPDKDAAIKNVIKEVVENYDSVESVAGDYYNFYKNYNVGGKTKKILVVVSDRPGVEGRIITAYPG